MVAVNSQFAGRWPHPVVRSASNVSPGTTVPKFVFEIGPHVSTLPVAAGLCAALFNRLQSATKSRSLSVHERVADCTIVLIGFGLEPMPLSVWPRRYLLKATLMAVLPLPVR